jgi:molybdopterin/thiamine biosynthesis adenylyltransferase
LTSIAEWYERRNDRQMRYAGRVLSIDRPIAISVEPAYASTYAGQVCTLVAANLLSRMTPVVVLDVPDVEIVAPLPWAMAGLRATALSVMIDADPHATFEMRDAREADYVLRLGREASPASVHGRGWYAFVGPGRSDIPPGSDTNPIGPGFAAIAAVARLFGLGLAPLDGPFFFNTFDWSHRPSPSPIMSTPEINLGNLWTVGAGSVGTAALFFLTLATRQFRAVTFDMDRVKIENLDRSPIFAASDASQQRHKSEVTTDYLRRVGVADAAPETEALDLSRRWMDRAPGTPDILIAAANERDVRYVIEQSCPPLQIYGTTAANWGASVFRHIPMVEPCSCCIFPPSLEQATMRCGEGKVLTPTASREVDAAMPFLSFAAGLMAAAEVLKTSLPGFPFSPQRTAFCASPSTTPRFSSFSGATRPGCTCENRARSVHERMISGTRYAQLSSSA